MKTEVIVADYANQKQGRDVVELLDAYAKDPMGGGKPLSRHARDNLIAALAQRPDAFTVLCYVDDEAAGLVNCFEGFSTFSCQPLMNIHDVTVLKKFRGLGLSQLLLAEVENIAKARGCCKLTLEVLEGNQAAQKAYLKNGFAGYELDPAMGRALFWQKQI